MESRLGVNRELKKVVDEIVSAMEKSKYDSAEKPLLTKIRDDEND